MPKKRSPLQTKLEYYAARSLVGAIGLFPLKTSMRIGKGAGRFIGSRLAKLQKTGRRNLEIALPELPENEKDKILSGTFESLGRQLGLVAHFGSFTPERVRETVEVVGLENFNAAYERGKGVLFFTGHFGSWEIFFLLPYAFGYGMNMVVRRVDNPLVENFVDNLRTHLGCRTLDKTQSARQMFRVLKKGELLGVMADLNVQEREGVFVDFFGTPASTTTGIAKLALATNAAVLPAFAVWNEAKQKYVVHLEPALSVEKSADSDADIKSLTQKMTNVVEEYIRRYPEQWLWIHKRWNTRPKGEKGLY